VKNDEIKRGRGRPPKTEGKLAQWIERSSYTREEIAEKLGITRHYLDHICRETRRPSLRVASAIEELTKQEISASYFAKVENLGVKRK